MTFDDASAAVAVLKTQLETALAGSYAATFAKWGGADVLLEDATTKTQRPSVRLALAGGDGEPGWGIGARRARVDATVIASGGGGAIKGAANATPSDLLLSRALKAILRDKYALLRDAGLYACTVSDAQERNEDTKNGLIHNNRHVIEFIYFGG